MDKFVDGLDVKGCSAEEIVAVLLEMCDFNNLTLEEQELFLIALRIRVNELLQNYLS